MQEPKRKISAGTVIMLALTAVVLIGTVFVMGRLSSGKPVDLSQLKPGALDLQEQKGSAGGNTTVPKTEPEEPSPAPAAAQEAEETEVPESTAKTFTLAVAGTVSLDNEVRKNSYFSDVKQYDYYDTMTLLKKELQADLNIAFLENLLTDEGKITDVTAPAAAAAMLKAAGFNAVACGFSKSYDKEEDGIRTTRKLLAEQGIIPLGIYDSEREDHFRILEINGIQIALLQYTDTIASGTRKSMIKKETSGMVPAADAEAIAADIAQARGQGAQAVLVLLNWGKTGKAPDKAMRALAQEIADAGADLIVGNGSRIVSGAENLTAQDTGRQVLCVWSLGTVLSGDRSNIKRIAGMMLQATVRTEEGHTVILDFRYVPLYTWKYKQDGRMNYRCLAANGSVPDGMDADQQKMMAKAADTIRNVMKDTPAEERTGE